MTIPRLHFLAGKLSLHCIQYRHCCSALEHRTLFADSELRDLLGRYATTGKAQLSAAEGGRLRALVNETALSKLFDWIDGTLDNPEKPQFTRTSPPALQRLLKAVSQPSPIVGLILSPSATLPELRKIVRDEIMPRQSPSALTLLQTNCPCLFDLLWSDLCSGLLTFPLPVMPLLKLIVQRCEEVVTSKIRLVSLLILMFRATSTRDQGPASSQAHID